MAKVRGPLFSLTAQGKFGQSIYYQKRGNSFVAVTRWSDPQSSRKGRNDFKEAIAYGIRFWNFLCNFRIAIGENRQCIPLWLANRAPPDQDAYHFYNSLWLDFSKTPRQLLSESRFGGTVAERYDPFFFAFDWGQFPGESPRFGTNFDQFNVIPMSLLLYLDSTGYIELVANPKGAFEYVGYYNSNLCRFLGDGRGNSLYLQSDNYLVAPEQERRII